MSIYINGIGAITPQGCFPSPDFLKDMKFFPPGRMLVTEPVYSDFIKPVQLRRMSKIIKMGLASAVMCMNDAQIKMPDAIITATGLGSVYDTDKFLNNLLDDQEKLLNPTPFIQSTHNAIAARIAIETGCHEYNMTYVHKNAAFEHAILDSILKLESGLYENILVGSTDEITEENYNLKTFVGFWKENIGNTDLLKNKGTPGTIAGEGSVFFNLSNVKSSGCYATIDATGTYYRQKKNLAETLKDFLSTVGYTKEKIDLVLLGINGNAEEDHIYYDEVDEILPNALKTWYKHLCGEYETSSGFAVMLAADILKTQQIPSFIKLTDQPPIEIKKILVYQQRNNRNHAFTILSSC